MTLWRVRATVDDRPGFLALLAASLGLRSVNILSVQVHATGSGAVDEFLVDAPDHLTPQDLAEAVRRGRGRDPWVARSDVRGLVDEPTRVLGLAARVAADPAELEDALLALLGHECVITSQPDGTAPDGTAPDGCRGGVLVLSGGRLLVRRREPAFTPAEYARAHALLRIAGLVGEPAQGSNR
jgi:hypothetical protein